MQPVLKLLAACTASLVLYGFVFGFVLHKPLTIGIVGDLVAVKRSYAERIVSPKLVIFAGSNARFSHRCETIEMKLGVPCVNFGIGRGIGIDYLLAKLTPVLHAGDVVYMPFEYDWYLDDKAQVMSGPDAALMFYGEKQQLARFGPERMVRAFFQFDLPFAISAISEMALYRVGFQRRYNLSTLTAQGDEKGHTPERAAAYADFIASMRATVPSPSDLAAPSYMKKALAEFLVWASGRGVTVVGGLQTAPDDINLTTETIQVLQRFYESNGQHFLVLANHSLYPRSCFYDTLAHLNQDCQIEHSKLLASALTVFLKPRLEISGRAP